MPLLPNIIETTDAAGTTATSYVLNVGQSVQGTLTSGDSDSFRVTLIAGHTYTVSLVGTGFANVGNTWLEVQSSLGTVLYSDSYLPGVTDSGLPSGNTQITFTALTTGTYYLNAEGYSVTTNTGQYGLSISEGLKGSFDDQMGAGVINSDATWSSTGAPVTVTYAFRQTMGQYGEPTFSAANAAQMAAVEQALQYWSDLCGITFQRVNDAGSSYSDNATMLFGCYNKNDGAGAYAYYPSTQSYGGDVWMNLRSVSTTASGLSVGNYSFFAILHEIGHALGLSHPGNYNAGVGVNITYANNAEFVQDTQQYTVMSYFDETAAGTAQFNGYADAPMLYDVMAIQALYGADMTTRTGDTTYGYNSNAGALFNFSSNATPAFCLWDAGGTDTLDCSGHGGNQWIDLREGQYSNINGLTGNVAIAYGAVIENAIGGSGNDVLNGNAANNVLTGGLGNDSISGGGGNDLLRGAEGDDTLYGEAGDDRMGGKDGSDQLYGGDGNDQLWGDAGNDMLDGGVGDDLLRGGSDDDVLRGNDGLDLLYGDAGNDRLGGKEGSDQLYGGDGNDQLWGDTGNDTLEGGSGNDTLRGGDDDDLVRGNEGDDVLYGDAGNDRLGGKDGDDRIVGGVGNDQLWGDSGNDVLDGGAGNDVMFGGLGDDVFYLSIGYDTINGSDGIDTLYATGPSINVKNYGGGSWEVTDLSTGSISLLTSIEFVYINNELF